MTYLKIGTLAKTKILVRMRVTGAQPGIFRGRTDFLE